MSENEAKLLELICSRSWGVYVYEVKAKKGMTYQEIEEAFEGLKSQGYRISASDVGGCIHALALSPYDKRYDDLIKNRRV